MLFLFIAEEITNLRGQLQKKDEEMRAMEERYKKYLEKAKTVCFQTVLPN